MTDQPDFGVPAWLGVAEVARVLGVTPSKVRQMARDHELAVVRRASGRELEVPAAFLQDGEVVRGLAGTLTLLADRGFSDGEAIEWLFTAEDSLPGTPIEALRGNRGREVRRRAQVIA
jgi:excisionase family DNA binding protein